LPEDIYFKYISVGAKNIKSIKEGSYREIYQVRKKLEKEGFSWLEKPLITYEKKIKIIVIFS